MGKLTFGLLLLESKNYLAFCGKVTPGVLNHFVSPTLVSELKVKTYVFKDLPPPPMDKEPKQ